MHDKSGLTLQARNINGDSVQLHFKSRLILTVINEPACTGCKLDLLKHMKTRRSYDQLYLVDWQSGIIDRKNYRNYIRELHAGAKDIYSLSNDSNIFIVNDSMIKLPRESSPYQLWIYGNGHSVRIRKFGYKDIFEETYLRDAYLDSLDEF